MMKGSVESDQNRTLNYGDEDSALKEKYDKLVEKSGGPGINVHKMKLHVPRPNDTNSLIPVFAFVRQMHIATVAITSVMVPNPLAMPKKICNRECFNYSRMDRVSALTIKILFLLANTPCLNMYIEVTHAITFQVRNILSIILKD